MKRDKERYAWVQEMRDTFKEVEVLTVKETLAYRAKWRERFADGRARGRNIPMHNCLYCGGRRSSYDWHAFSFTDVPNENGYVKRMRTASHPEERVVAWVERCGLPGVIVRLHELADYLEKIPAPREELYIMPRKMGWTLVFTHEEDMGCGPYFVDAEG